MKHTFKRAMSLFMALAMVLTMVPSFGTHVHAEELETEPVVVTEEPATEAPVVEVPVEEVPETEAPTQAPETEAPATEAPTEEPEAVETEAPETVETEAPEVETEPVEETEAVEETVPDETEETIPEEILDEEIIEEEAVMAVIEAATPEGTCTVDGLEIRYDAEITEARSNHTLIRAGKAEWKVNGNKLSGDLVGGHGNRRAVYYRYEVNSTLTLKNTKNEGAELSFSYTLNLPDGEATIDGTTYEKTVSEPVLFVKVLQPGEFITINLVANPNTQQNSELPDNGSSIVITSLNLATFGNVNITYSEAVGGNYKVTNAAGEEYTVPGDVSVPATEWLTMTAMPDAGYAFAGWYNETTGSYLSADLEYTTLFADDCTIAAKFLPVVDGVYGVGDAVFADLTAAGQAADGSKNKVVVLLKDATLTGSHVIPRGVTLLIPYNAEHTFNAEDPESLTVTYNQSNPYVKPVAFRTLTMAAGATITVDGAISVNAPHTSCVGGAIYGGTVYRSYGEIKMQDNAKITLNKGANLYAWGYVWGSGSVEALNGATIYEKMQVTDYRGGTNTAAIVARNLPDDTGKFPENADRTFPFNQYYIQNVEVKEILHEGATLMAHAAVNLAGDAPVEAAVEFIGTSSAMFAVSGATITKEYIPATDRLALSIDGDENSSAALNALTLDMNGMIVNSENFVLPINSNIDINIHAGTAYINQELVLQPGVRVYVSGGASLITNENIFVMDADQWGAFVFSEKRQQPVAYAPGLGGGSNRIISSDAVIDINGYISLVAGIYTTAGGAKIISSEETGEIEFFVDAPEDGKVYQLTGGANAYAIAATAAKLTNGNPGKPYTETKGAVEFDYYYYCPDCQTWQLDGEECEPVVNSYEVTWDLGGGYVEIESQKFESFKDDYDENVTPSYGNRPTPVKDASGCTVYTFAGWKDVNGTEYPVGTALPAVTADTTYFAYFTAETKHSFTLASDQVVTEGNCQTEAVYKAKCSVCGEVSETETVKGDKNPTNHASDEVTKVFKDSEYHTVTHTCCGTPEVVEHDSGDVTCCSCGGISFYMMFDDESVELISFTSGGVVPVGSFIDPSKPVTVEAKHNVGSGVIIMYINPQGLSVESYSGTLEIPADKINPNARLVVYIDATVNVTIQLNGGSIPEAVKAEMHAMGITVTDSAFVYPAVYNGGDWCPIAELVTYDGHSIESVTDKDGKNYYYVDVEEVGPEIVLKNLTEDLELTINWTCDALTDVAEVPATCGADGVKAHKVCACSKAYDADGNEIADLEAWKKADGKIDATGEHVDGDDKNHDCDNCSATNVDDGCYGGTATCMAAAVCAECGETYGEKNPDNHTGKTTAEDNEDGKTHKLVCECGETTVTSEPHTYVNGICACEAVQTFTVTFDGNGKKFYIYADSNYLDTLPVTVTYGGAAEALGLDEKNADGNKVWRINDDKKVLSGWNTKADGTGEHYAIGAEIKPTGDMTLYAIWKEVAVGGVGLNSGEYLDLNGNVTTTMPESGYAYYKDGTLTLNNYSYTGEGYMHQTSPDMTAAVYGRDEDLTIVLVGENRLKNTSSMGYDSAVYAGNLTILGEGTLTGEASGYGLKADTAIEIQGGTLNLTAYWAVYSYGTVTVSGGTVTGNGQGTADKGWTLENNVKLLKPVDGYVDEHGYLCDAEGSPARSFKLARAYTVTFLDKDRKQIGEAQTVEHGFSATAPTAPDVTGYTFDKWDKDFTEVTSDLTVQAVYKVNEYTLTVNVLANGETVELTVPYGANLLEVLAAAAKEGKILAIGAKFGVKIPNDHIGYNRTTGYSYCIPEDESWIEVDGDMTMPAGDFEIDQDCLSYGWIFRDLDGDGVDGAEYYLEGYGYLTGWQYVEEDYDDVEGGAWYYFDTVLIDDVEYYYRAEGISRVPYPSDKIEGNTYAPSQEDIDYANKVNNDEDPDNDINFVDGTTGLFWFDENGVFKYDYTGHVPSEDTGSWAVNGLIAWHVGLVTDGEDYYYFVGDEEIGGNKLATGDVYVARNSTSREFVIGGVYTFSEEGPLCEYDGITEVNGKLRYYEDAQLMLGKGLTKVGENYIYVRSNGELVVNNEYYISANSLGIATGIYEFDENGYMIDPAPADKNGVFAEDGGLYYYENGKRTYAGLIEYNGGIIYVTSSGKLATGKYWVTKTNGMVGYDAGFYFFDEDGYMEQERNGIVPGKDENGNDVLYYYENNQIKYNAGLIEYLIEYNKHLIYVRSNGQLAIGTYWITNTNRLKDAGCYEFDENGFMIVNENKDGIVEENGKLYYYEDGIKQIGTGLIELETGKYIYVKTNGELATGLYWPTNTNGIDIEGMFDFGTDGILTLTK